MKNSAIAIAILFAAGTASATTTLVRLPDDASNLTVVSARQAKVVVGENCPQDDSMNEEGTPVTCAAVWAPGLKVEVSFHAKGAFESWDGSDAGPTFVDFGTDVFDVPAATALVSATLVQRQVEEQVVDEKNSKFCPGSIEGNGSEEDPFCREDIKTANVLVNRTFLSIETK